MVQRLPRDFRITFPQPTDDAIDNGVISQEDATLENIKALHQEHAREALFYPHNLDTVLDARRKGVDPMTGKAPRTHAGREKLRQFFQEEPGRLECAFENTMAVYREAFGADAADAFTKAIRAWQAGIEVVGEKKPDHSAAPSQELFAGQARRPSRVRAVMPVPKPLRSAIAAGRFGMDGGVPVNPSGDEVHSITSNHAEKLIELLHARDEPKFQLGIAKYAEDFGDLPAGQLERYARRKAEKNSR